MRIDIIKIKSNIYEISYKEFVALREKWSRHQYIDHSLFICKIYGSYLCMDNSIDNCLIKELSTRDRAICWLLRCDYNAEELENMQDIEVRHLLAKEDYVIYSIDGIEEHIGI